MTISQARHEGDYSDDHNGPYILANLDAKHLWNSFTATEEQKVTIRQRYCWIFYMSMLVTHSSSIYNST